MNIEDNGAASVDADDTSLDTIVDETAEGHEPEGQETGEDTAAPEGEQQPERRKLTARERVEQAVARQREAERERDVERRVREAAEQREAQLLDRFGGKQPPAQVPQQGDGRPDPSAYADGTFDPDYIEALTDWKAEQTVSRVISQREAGSNAQRQLADFNSRVAQAFPDGEPEGLVALRRLQTIPAAVQEVLMTEQNGPKLADYLGRNLAELQRLAGLSAAKQGAELARIEARITAPPPSPKTATDAPEPAPVIRGSGGQFKIAPDTSDFAAFERQYGG